MRAELSASTALVLATALAAPAAARGEATEEAAEGDAGGPAPTASDEAAESSGPDVALGVSAAWLRRNDYGDRARSTLAPELVGLAYLPTASERLFLRPGIRLAYVGLTPAAMPDAVRFVERDATLAAELGALYDGVVIPAVAIGAGVTVRRLELVVDDPIAADEDPVSRWEVLPSAYAQVGAGVPFAGGLFVVEPFARFEVMADDDRARWRYGVDLSVALP